MCIRDSQYAVHVGIVLEIVVLDGYDSVDEIYDLLEALFLDVFEQRLLLVGEHQLVLVRLGIVFVGGEIGVPIALGVGEHLLGGGIGVYGAVTTGGRRSLRTYAFPVEHGVVAVSYTHLDVYKRQRPCRRWCPYRR